MDINSTPFISYRNIKINDVDLVEDAWGLNTEFFDVISLLKQIDVTPDKMVTKRLISRIRQIDK